jgi:uroporphyrinogen decarboxylase
MTSRERWLAVLNREEPDRIPMDWWDTDEIRNRVMAHLGVDTLDEMFTMLHVDQPVTVEPAFVGPPVEPDEDPFGVGYSYADYGTGRYREAVRNPLAAFETVEQIDSGYRWPQADWWDCSPAVWQVEGKEERPIQFVMSGVYTMYTRLRGMEQAFVDYAVNQDIVLYCMEKLVELHCEIAERMFECIPGRIDIAMLYNDMGSQLDLLFSPQTARALFLPGLRRMAALAREKGARVFLHSDGAIRKMIPDFIEAGIQILNPVQWRCRGMNRADLKRDFGDKLVFHGAVDNQQTLARGTTEEVRREVRDNIDVLGAGGGYILAPCHRLQAVNPPENVVAMYEEGYSYGRLSPA